MYNGLFLRVPIQSFKSAVFLISGEYLNQLIICNLSLLTQPLIHFLGIVQLFQFCNELLDNAGTLSPTAFTLIAFLKVR